VIEQAADNDILRSDDEHSRQFLAGKNNSGNDKGKSERDFR
jgi:hypothetical protein